MCRAAGPDIVSLQLRAVLQLRIRGHIVKGVTSEVIAEVRSRANILEVVSEVVVLKRAGKEHKGLCPFHQEKTPSFNVNPEKGIFKCFGCGEGGDAFAFVQKVRGIDFIDAVRELAHKYGVRLIESEEERKEFDKRSFILMLYQQASEYYCHLLRDPSEGATARAYLESRGISEDIVERFKLGYATHGWDGLIRYLTASNKVALSTLEEAGLVRRKVDSNSYYDLFRHRLMIPICDEQGRVIAFGGRTLGDDQVKYLNSPETPLYIKGQHLYGFHQAKEAIKASDSVIVVEGYFDAISAHQHGFENAVATLGTALTEQQAKLMVRYTDSKRVYFCFDADAAGVRAVERGVETLNQIAEGIGIELRVIRIPGGKDPDECLRSLHVDAAGNEENGAVLFHRAVEEAPLLIDYQLQEALAVSNTTTHMGRIDAARKLVPILAQIKNAVARGEYIRQWAARVGVREEELLSDVGQFRRDNRIGSGAGYSQRAPLQGQRPLAGPKFAALVPDSTEAERLLLALYLTAREDNERVSAAMADETFVNPVHQQIKDALEGIGTQFNNIEDLQHKLMDRLAPNRDASAVLVDIILKVDVMRKQNAPVDVLLKDASARLLLERINLAKASLRSHLATARDESIQDELQSRILQLKQVETVSLPSAQTLEDLDELKRKIGGITALQGGDRDQEAKHVQHAATPSEPPLVD